MVFFQQGLHDHARLMFKEALRIQRVVLGDDHEDVAIALSALGSTMKNLGRLRRAIELTNQEPAICREFLVEKHMNRSGGETLIQS
jgi:hypothetical protein